MKHTSPVHDATPHSINRVFRLCPTFQHQECICDLLTLCVQVMFIDLDTLVVRDMSCIYKLDSFVVAPGLIYPSFNVLNLWLRPKNKSHKELKNSPKYRFEAKHFVFGDIWMVNEKLLNDTRMLEKEFLAEKLYPLFDIQSLWSFLHANNYTGFHDLAAEYSQYCWGYQWVRRNNFPKRQFAAGFRLGAYKGELYCTDTCKKVTDSK